jgi:diaminopimelate epimerase
MHMRLHFTKMHGLGNDFIVFDCRDGASPPPPALLRRLADRRTGIGYDQALIIGPPAGTASAASYRVFNADGEEAEQCGNGVRCIARLLVCGRDEPPSRLILDSRGGPVEARIDPDGNVSVNMGEPRFGPTAVAATVAGEEATIDLTVGSETLRATLVSMGNPHVVLRVGDIGRAAVATLGPAIERHPLFPRRTNVEFAQRESPRRLKLRVFERGVGETRACGTGACAAVAAGRLAGDLDAEVAVRLPGGELHVSWPGPGQALWLAGPAIKVFEGNLEA